MTKPACVVEVYDDAGSLAEAAAGRFVKLAQEAAATRGRFTVALAGGTTPNQVYDLLATHYRDAVPWPVIDVFWGDERHVPPTHHESNYHAESRRTGGTGLTPAPAGPSAA